MIVVEDIEANEIRRFFVVDASLQLGIVRAGTYIRTFDPDRAFSYYTMVENQLHDFAASYSGAFRYVPRRAYEYLKKPRFLTDFSQDASELSKSSWLVDLLVANPLIDLGETALPVAQQNANTESVYRWSTVPPTSPRVYHLQDMRQNRRTPPGWGCILRAANLPLALKGPNRADLIDHIKSERPVFMELTSSENLDLLLEWLVLLKEAGLKAPKLVLKVRSQKDWGKSITRLLDIPDSTLLTAGASISSLSTSINYMKSEQKDLLWSKRIMFASSYPETQLGDSVSEIISYFLSRNLAASPEEVQRVLGGNMLSLLPPRPPFLVYTENKTSVMAEESLGKAAMNEIIRVLQLLDAKKILRVVSVDHMVDDEGGTVQLDSVVVTVSGPNGEKGTSISIVLEKNGAVMVSGWKKAFTESISKRDSMLLQTLVCANAKLDGPVFGLPAHLAQFDDALLSCLQVEDRKELVSALHFGVEIAKTNPGVFLMASSDMQSLNLLNDDYVLVLGTRTGRWCAGRVREHDMRAERMIVISETDAEIYGFSTSSVVNIVKFQGEISDIHRIVMAYCSDRRTSNQELFSWMHLNESEVLDRIRGRLVGSSSRLFVGSEKLPVTLNMTQTEPELVSDQIGVIPEDEVFLRPNQAFRELNVVLCISTCKDMSKRDIKLKTIRAATRELEPLARRIGELKVFLDDLTEDASRSEIAALGALLVINLFRHNHTEGRFGFATFAEGPSKFSVQHGSEIRSYMEFLGDVQSEEVLVSLIYSILDSVKDSAGREDMAGAYRTIAEYLDDFGASRPTLILVISGGVGRDDAEHIPFIKAIKERERYQIEFVTLEKDRPPTDALRFLKEVNAGVTPLDSFSSQTFIGHILDVVEELVPASSTPEFDA